MGSVLKRIKDINIFNVFTICFSLIFLTSTIYLIYNKSFDHDELEQAHLAWQVKEGYTIYQDFSESHGPVLPIINVALWRFFNWPDKMETLIYLRNVSLFYLIVLSFFIFKLVNISRLGSLTAFLFLTNTVVALKGIEIRADVLQNLFLFSGLFFMLFGSKRISLLSGILFGLALFTNFKSILFVPIFLLLYNLLFFKEKRFPKIILVFSGMSIIIFIGIVILYSQGILKEYFINTIYLKMLTINQPNIGGYMWTCFNIFIRENILFISLYVSGSFFIIKNIRKTKRELVLVSFLSLILLGFSLKFAYWCQWYLSLIPFMVIVAAYGFNQLLDLMYAFFSKMRNNKKLIKKETFQEILTILLIGYLLINLMNPSNEINKRNNKEQIKEANYLLNITNKDDKFFYIWESLNGAYVFRPSLLYFWHLPLNIEMLVAKYFGEDLLGDGLIEKLEKCKVVLATNQELARFSVKTRKYISENYNKIDQKGIWLR